MSADDNISADAQIVAVRGPLTWRRAAELGVGCPKVFGDPGLLLPRIYSRPVAPARRIGLAAHFSDRPRLVGQSDLPGWISLIDMQGSVEAVVDSIRAHELVATSSLHGLILSHAYGIPATWIEFKPLPSGDRSKFYDYLESIGAQIDGPLCVSRKHLDLDELRSRAIEPGSINLDALWDTCPFRR